MLPFSSPEDLLSPGIEPVFSAMVGGFFTAAPPGKPKRATVATIVISVHRKANTVGEFKWLERRHKTEMQVGARMPVYLAEPML